MAVIVPSISFVQWIYLGWFYGNGIVIYRFDTTKSTMQRGKRQWHFSSVINLTMAWKIEELPV